MENKKITAIILWIVSLVYLYLYFPMPAKVGALPFKYLFLVFYTIAVFYLFQIIEKLEDKKAQGITAIMSVALLLTGQIILLIVLLCLGIYFYYRDSPSWQKISVVMFLLVITYVFVGPNIATANQLSIQSQPILSDNWFEMFNWIKNNTAECSVVATYWDPGHFITGIAERPVVYDGGSQNAKAEFNKSDVDMSSKAFDDILLYEEKDGKIIRSRMKDMATVLYTSDEEKAVDILELYKGNCSEMYFLASSDLIGKSQWWSYFATWTPNTESGEKSVYYPARLTMDKKADNGTNYVYSIGSNQAFVVNVEGSDLTPYLKQGSEFLKIGRLFYFDENNGYLKTIPDADMNGILYLTPGNQMVYYIPEEIADSVFTKAYFFNGQGLDNFEYVDSWGGEVKLFQVNFD